MHKRNLKNGTKELFHGFFTYKRCLLFDSSWWELTNYLKLIWKEQLYQFCVLPNGLSPCPRWFTKLLKPPLAELRKSKHDISAYINDIYFQDDTKENWTINIIDTVTLLRLGFTVDAEKSQFLPIHELDILGFTINSVNMTVTLKKEKKEELACLIRPTNCKHL